MNVLNTRLGICHTLNMLLTFVTAFNNQVMINPELSYPFFSFNSINFALLKVACLLQKQDNIEKAIYCIKALQGVNYSQIRLVYASSS
jgi:hypothetical protein